MMEYHLIYQEALPFNVKYLSGVYADSSDVAKNLYDSSVEDIAEPMASRELKKTRDFSRYGCSNPKLNLAITDVKTAYYPVYFLAIRSKDDTINYAVVTGQTGKCAVEMPIDFKKYVLFSLLLAIPIFLFLNFAFTLTPTNVAIIALIMSIINLIISCSQTSSLNRKDKRLDDKGYKYNNSLIDDKKVKKNKTKVFKLLLGIVISIGVLFINPVSDFYYYGAAIVALILKQYNSLVGRKLAQLGKRGGDESE